MKWHPDRNQGSEEEKAKAVKKIQEINEAYSVLSDPEKKRKFDMGGYDPTDPEGASAGFTNMNVDPNDIFKMFFGGAGGGMGGFGADEDFFSSFGSTGSRGGRSAGSAGGMGGMGGMPGFTFMSGGGMPNMGSMGGMGGMGGMSDFF